MAKTRKAKALSGSSLAMACATEANDKKAGDVVVLDMRGISSITDYFVICSGTSDRQVKAIADAVREGVKKRGSRCFHCEGLTDASWIVLDFGDVIAHIFLEETRSYYNLERLWGDALNLEYSSRLGGMNNSGKTAIR